MIVVKIEYPCLLPPNAPCPSSRVALLTVRNWRNLISSFVARNVRFQVVAEPN